MILRFCGKSGDATVDENGVVTGVAPGTAIINADLGSYVLTCTVTVVHEHTFSEEWSHDETHHWHVAICEHTDEVSGKEEHIWDEGSVTTKPTETAPGIKTYTCTVCNKKKTETIEPLSHTHNTSAGWTYDTAGHWHACSGCNEKVDYSTHSENGGVVTVQPTAVSNGVRTYSCTVCGAVTRTEIIPAVYIPSYIPTDSSYTLPSYIDPASAPTDDPFISDNSSARGWEAITSEIFANTDGSAVKIDMNGADKLPGAVLEALENQDVTIEVRMNNKVSWKINGLDVIDPQTADMRVSTASRKILESVIEELGSEKKPIQLRLYHNGDFGFKTTLSLNVGRNYNDKYAMLYYYDLKTKQPEFVGQCLVSDGKAEFELTHASYYAVTFSSVPLYEDVSAAAGTAADSMPIDVAVHVTNGIGIPAVRLPSVPNFSNKKRRYRILRKRRIEEMVFVY